MLLAYNAGRILSYVVVGAVAGVLGGASLALADQLPARIALYVLANPMLVALGLYLLEDARVGVQRALRLPVVAPSAAVVASLSAGAARGAGFPARPGVGLATVRPGL